MRGPMQDAGAGPLWAVLLWRHHVQSTVLRSLWWNFLAQWPSATAFSIARGSTKQQSSHLKFEVVWGYICHIDLPAPDKVYLHKSNTTKLEGTAFRKIRPSQNGPQATLIAHLWPTNLRWGQERPIKFCRPTNLKRGQIGEIRPKKVNLAILFSGTTSADAFLYSIKLKVTYRRTNYSLYGAIHAKKDLTREQPMHLSKLPKSLIL